MLVLSRKRGQWLQFADDVLVAVLSVKGCRVKLGFLAPNGTDILRTELLGRDEAAEYSADPESSGFLVLSRKANESIRIGTNITLKVLCVRKNGISVGIEAPKTIRIHRGELKPQNAS